MHKQHPDTLLLAVGAVSFVLLLSGWIVGGKTTTVSSTGFAVLGQVAQAPNQIGIIFLSVGASMIASLLTTSLVLYYKSKSRRH